MDIALFLLMLLPALASSIAIGVGARRSNAAWRERRDARRAARAAIATR